MRTSQDLFEEQADIIEALKEVTFLRPLKGKERKALRARHGCKYQLAHTDYFLVFSSRTKNQWRWLKHHKEAIRRGKYGSGTRHYRTVSFLEVLESVPPKIAEQLLFYMHLFQ